MTIHRLLMLNILVWLVSTTCIRRVLYAVPWPLTSGKCLRNTEKVLENNINNVLQYCERRISVMPINYAANFLNNMFT